MRPDRWWVIAVPLVLSVGAFAAEPSASPSSTGAKKATSKAKIDVPKIDLSGIGAIPKADGIQPKRAEASPAGPGTGDPELKFEVITVAHARQFTRTAKGYAPVGGLLRAIALEGNPPSTQRFTTFVRVRANRETDAAIEIAVLDPRGDTAMSGSGQVRFKRYGGGADADWTIDWDPTPHPRGGKFQVLVRVAGRPMGTWPLEVVSEKR